MQSARVRPEPTPQRQAAITHGAVFDHAGSVQVAPLADFDLNRTIFQTLEGGLPRAVMSAQVGKEVVWDARVAKRVKVDYDAILEARPLPPVDPALLDFMVDQCDFDVEHADGSFLDHLYYCFEYTVRHDPHGSPIVMLLHSILGTGTNTFAMGAEKIPALQSLLTQGDFRQIAAFPSVLRLLYDAPMREELWDRMPQADELRAVRMRRVMDNAPIELTGEEFWRALNYQLVHLTDFLPVANWVAHKNQNTFLLFSELYALLEAAGKLEADIAFAPPVGPRRLDGEALTWVGWALTQAPAPVIRSMTARSVRKYSSAIGHELSFELVYR